MNLRFSVMKLWYRAEYNTLEVLSQEKTRTKVVWSKVQVLLKRCCVDIKPARNGETKGRLSLIKEDNKQKNYERLIIYPRNNKLSRQAADETWNLLQEAEIVPEKIWVYLSEWKCISDGHVKKHSHRRS